MSKVGRPAYQDILTPAEWRVVSLAQHGMTNQQIADNLNVSINAVKYHMSNVIGKLQTLPNTKITDKKSLMQFLGAPKESAFHRSNHMNTNTSIQSIGQIARTVSNADQAEQWYRDVLGLKHLYSFDKLTFFDVDGVRLMLSENEQLCSESIIYFQTEDIKGMHQQLTDKGVTFTHTPHKVHTHSDGTEEWMAFFNDPDGRPLGLMGQIKA